jgi:hypothetical protein
MDAPQVRRFEVIDNPAADTRFPFALKDCQTDVIIRIGQAIDWLRDYAFECELADEVTYDGRFLLRVEDQRDKWRPRLTSIPKTEDPA